MNTETYEQSPLTSAQVGDALPFITENAIVDVLFYGDEPLGIELPAAVELRVAESDPGIKGDTVSGSTKPARVETGLVVQVPLFIGPGDVIKVDTRTRAYLERVSTG